MMKEADDEAVRDATMNIQCKGVTIPFKSLEGGISFRIMVYM